MGGEERPRGFLMATEPDYVVIRAGAGLPDGFLPDRLDGLWLDKTQIAGPGEPLPGLPCSEAVAVPAGRFEVRSDGAVAEVWELRV